MPRHVKRLSVSPPPLLQPQRLLSPSCCCPCSWAQLRQPAQQTESICSHNGDAHGSPDLPSHLAQLPRPCLPPLGSAHSCNPRLGKHEEKLVQIRGEISPGSGHQLTILQPPKVPKSSNQRSWWRLQLARTSPSRSVEPDIIVVQLHLVLVIETSSSPGGALSLHPPWVPGLARAYNFELREARPGAVRS